MCPQLPKQLSVVMLSKSWRNKSSLFCTYVEILAYINYTDNNFKETLNIVTVQFCLWKSTDFQSISFFFSTVSNFVFLFIKKVIFDTKKNANNKCAMRSGQKKIEIFFEMRIGHVMVIFPIRCFHWMPSIGMQIFQNTLSSSQKQK